MRISDFPGCDHVSEIDMCMPMTQSKGHGSSWDASSTRKKERDYYVIYLRRPAPET